MLIRPFFNHIFIFTRYKLTFIYRRRNDLERAVYLISAPNRALTSNFIYEYQFSSRLRNIQTIYKALSLYNLASSSLSTAQLISAWNMAKIREQIGATPRVPEATTLSLKVIMPVHLRDTEASSSKHVHGPSERRRPNSARKNATRRSRQVRYPNSSCSSVERYPAPCVASSNVF